MLFRSGDHFSEEAGEEEHHAENHGDKGKVENRLVGDGAEIDSMCLTHKLFHNYPDGDYGTNEEHRETAVAEEIHRLLAEGAQEPEADEIQQAIAETAHSELALAEFALLVVHFELADTGVSGILSQIGDVTVHLTVNFYILYHLAAVCLEAAVHVVQLYAGDTACRGVEQLGGQVFGEDIVFTVP